MAPVATAAKRRSPKGAAATPFHAAPSVHAIAALLGYSSWEETLLAHPEVPPLKELAAIARDKLKVAELQYRAAVEYAGHATNGAHQRTLGSFYRGHLQDSVQLLWKLVAANVGVRYERAMSEQNAMLLLGFESGRGVALRMMRFPYTRLCSFQDAKERMEQLAAHVVEEDVGALRMNKVIQGFLEALPGGDRADESSTAGRVASPTLPAAGSGADPGQCSSTNGDDAELWFLCGIWADLVSKSKEIRKLREDSSGKGARAANCAAKLASKNEEIGRLCREIANVNAGLASKDTQIKWKYKELASLRAVYRAEIQRKDAEISQARKEIASRDDELKSKDEQIISLCDIIDLRGGKNEASAKRPRAEESNLATIHRKNKKIDHIKQENAGVPEPPRRHRGPGGGGEEKEKV